MMDVLKLAVLLFLACGVLAACATAPPRPAGASRPFVIERDLLGTTTARGEFSAITGTRRAFTATLNGALQGDRFTLVEDFAFDDGEKDRKTWVLTRLQNGEWSGVREDVIGAARGFQDGDVFRLEYEVRLPSKRGEGRKVHFRDVLALDGNGAVVNNATVGWFGVRVGTVKLVIRRGAVAATGPSMATAI
jgi:hypothetical protein